jgi:PqqD family protein of HPr-rel-A system
MNEPMPEHLPMNPPTSDPLDIPADYVPRKCADVLDLDMGDGLVLFNRGSSVVHHLNPSAALVWQLCDGVGTVAQLSDDIAAEFELQPVTVQEQVGRLVGEFEALGLVEDASRMGG